MIPKIVHYCWFSGEPYPEEIQRCIDSWHKYLPDYEFRLWDMNAVKDIDNVFLQEALQERVWAFAADYVRLYALYHFGGIYLDTDIMVYKPFDDLLLHRAFIGKESYIYFVYGSSAQYLTSHSMGAEPQHPFIYDSLCYYDNRHFITSPHNNLPRNLRLNLAILPYIQAEIARQYGYEWRAINKNVQYCKEGLVIYPARYFNGSKNKHNYCHHLAFGGWLVKEEEKACKLPFAWYARKIMVSPIRFFLRLLRCEIKEL